MANRKTTVDMSEVLAGFAKLGDAKESVARTMGHAMGVEVRDEAKMRAPVLKPENYGVDPQTPGQLKRAIYVAYDDRFTILTPNSWRYTVSWNSTKAPHGHLIEFGHEMPYRFAFNAAGEYYTPKPEQPMIGGPVWVNAQPFLAPAFDAKLPRLASIAFTAGSRKFSEVMS